MEWTIIVCFESLKEKEVSLTAKCTSVLFAKDKPSAALHGETLRHFQKRCIEQFECDIFDAEQVDAMILGMIDQKKQLRNGMIAVLKKIKLRGCWFHFPQCSVGRVSDCSLIKLYKDEDDHQIYSCMRCYLMLPLSPKHLIEIAFNPLYSLSASKKDQR